MHRSCLTVSNNCSPPDNLQALATLPDLHVTAAPSAVRESGDLDPGSCHRRKSGGHSYDGLVAMKSKSRIIPAPPPPGLLTATLRRTPPIAAASSTSLRVASV